MSIYSGFATRNQEQTYDQLVFNLVQVLSRKILKTYNQEETDQSKFAQIIKELFMKLSVMQKQKYLQPNLSNALYDIMEFFIQKDRQEATKLQSKMSAFWVKIQKKQEQNFTNDTHKQVQVKPQSRQPTSRVESRLKTPIINPQVPERQKVKDKMREKHEQYAIPIKNKFNRQKNLRSKDNQRAKKHQSLRRIEQNELSQTIQKQEPQPKKLRCPHCQEQTTFRTSRKPILRSNQRSESLQKKQKQHSRIIIPELVKEYIQSTNHIYMKNFRKRKVHKGPEFY